MTNPDDFVDRIRADKAREAAAQKSIARPPRPRRTKKIVGSVSWAQTALEDETEKVATAVNGCLNDAINTAGFNLGQIVAAGKLDYDTVHAAIRNAALGNGYPEERLAREKLPERAIRDGMEIPRDTSNVGRVVAEKPAPTQQASKTNGHAQESNDRILRLKPLSAVKSRVPTWVWETEGAGRIQHGTLTMFAGKPAAGKSTAVRWFAARLSRGELPGIWAGHPMKVALVMAEEQTDAVVVPGLQAAGANLRNIFTPEIKIGDTEFSLSVHDEAALTEELLDNQVGALFIDPIMSTFGGKADIYRNNEVRAALEPFKRIATAINGIVVGVAHLKKGDVKDVLGGINGSSAFSEVPRAVFGFAPTESGEHVMEQVKNSAGPNGLKLAYKLPIEYMMADDGQPINLPRFEITGPTEISISDIDANTDETTTISASCNWLSEYLQREQPAASAQVKRDARQHGDINERMIARAAKRLGVKIETRSMPGKPHTTVWCLPDYDGYGG